MEMARSSLITVFIGANRQGTQLRIEFAAKNEEQASDGTFNKEDPDR